MMTSSIKPDLILIDGSSFLFRAYHALPPLANAQGEPTGAMYGVLNMIRKLLSDYEPRYLAVIFDAKGKTFRHDLFTAYKANRPEMDEDLRVQIQPLHDIIRAMGLPLIIINGVEADDVIGTFVKTANQQNLQTLIATSDKDMAQLVSDRVHLINTMSNTLLDPQGVIEKFGVTPGQIIDYLTLIGDSIDNVPGVPKVGPKTAAKWLADYGSLENIIANAEKFSGKVGEYLRDSLLQLPLSKQLVTLHCDVPDLVPITALEKKSPDNSALETFFKRYGFKQWLKQLDPTTPTEYSAPPILTEKNYQLILTEADLKNYLKQIEQTKAFAFDTETDSLDPISARLVGVSLAYQAHQACYIPVNHDYVGAPDQLSLETVLTAIKPLLDNPAILKIGQNFKYDMNVLKKYGVTLSQSLYDTMLASYVYDSTSNRHDMDTLAEKYLQYTTIKFTDVAGKGAQQLTFNQVILDKALTYSAEDADVTYQLHDVFVPRLAKTPRLQSVFDNIDMPVMPVLAEMEYRGVLIDAVALKKQSEHLQGRIQTLEETAFELAGANFNLNSPKQLQEILFEKLGLPILEKTPTGQASTAESVLQELAFNYPLADIILQYRSFSKLKSTYTDSLPEKIHPKTGRVHTSYHQAITSTGRLSSTDPNLQNIPVRTEEGRAIRQAFIAPTGYKIVAADYSQIELRIMAHLSQDAGLLNAFAAGLDIHKATASEVFGIAPEDVTSDQRRKAKAINFGLIYGMSAFGLAKQLGVERQEAQHYMDCYFHRYPKVKTYMENTRAFVHEHAYVETLFGRRLYLPEIKSRNKQRVMAIERAAINAPMQGTAADLMKIAMINTVRALSTERLAAYMIMQVHDELVFEIAEADLPLAMTIIQTQMENAVAVDVPLLVSIGVGDNWEQAH